MVVVNDPSAFLNVAELAVRFSTCSTLVFASKRLGAAVPESDDPERPVSCAPGGTVVTGMG
jgi:hypothetical protein